MKAAIASGRTTDDWEVPDSVEKVAVDKVSGYRAHDDLESYEEWVIKGTLPTEPDPIHQKVRLCHGQDKLATAADIQRGQFYEKVFITLREADPVSQDGRNRWQEGIDAWIAGQPNAAERRAEAGSPSSRLPTVCAGLLLDPHPSVQALVCSAESAARHGELPTRLAAVGATWHWS